MAEQLVSSYWTQSTEAPRVCQGESSSLMEKTFALDKFVCICHRNTMANKQTEALAKLKRTPEPIHNWHINRFVEKTKVRFDDGQIVMVPAHAEANRNACIMLAELARAFVASQMTAILDSKRPLTPQEIKEMMLAVAKANETCIVAHENILPMPDAPIKGSKTDTALLLKGVEAMAKGVSKGNQEAQLEAIERFKELGRKAKQAEAITVKVEPTP